MIKIRERSEFFAHLPKHRVQSFSSDPQCGLPCRFQQLSAARDGTLGRSIRVMNRAGACVSPHNITAESLESLNISSILPQQWQNFTAASSSESFVQLPTPQLCSHSHHE